jgi:hypothetical protein
MLSYSIAVIHLHVQGDSMAKLGRPYTYQSEEEKPVSVSLRLPRDLYEQAQQYVRMRRMTLTELLIDGLRLRLETPADPRDLLLSDDSNTVLQHVQELVNAAVQAALATGYPPTYTPTREAPAIPSDDIQHYDNNTVIQESATAVPQAAPVAQERRNDAISDATLQAIAAARKQYPDMALRSFGEHLFTRGIYRAVGKDGEAKPASLSCLHRWLGEAKAAGLL